MGRAVPQRSLPPCGGGTGRGVQQSNGPCLRSETQSPHSRYLEPAQDLLRTECFVATPLPVPPPHGGREPCGTHLRNSRPAQFEMCACPSASAGTSGIEKRFDLSSSRSSSPAAGS